MSCLQFLLVDDERHYVQWQRIWEKYQRSESFDLTFCDLTDESQVAGAATGGKDQAIAWCTDDAVNALRVIEHYAEHIHGFFIDVNLGNHALTARIKTADIEEAVSGLDGNVDGLRLSLLARWRNPSAYVVVITGCDPGADMEKVATANAYRIDLWIEKSASASLYFALRRAWDHARALSLSAPPDQGVVGLDDQRILVQRFTRGIVMEPILIIGETGTGKEVIANEIFQIVKSRDLNKSDSKCQFIPLNCAAIPESIIESELFGAVRGAYTGADRDRDGAFIKAGTGVLFLDEIGELPMASQAKLLRALETRKIQRLGNPEPVPVSARIVAATHRNLANMVREGTFREDLFHRISTLPIMIPPLRSRLGDIGALANRSLAECSRGLSQSFVMAEAGYDVLRSYEWPGNVRQLQKSIWRLCLLSGPIGGSLVGVQIISEAEVRREISSLRQQNLFGGLTGAIGEALDPKEAFAWWLQQRHENRAALSSHLGIDKRQLNKILEHLGFDQGSSGRKRGA